MYLPKSPEALKQVSRQRFSNMESGFRGSIGAHSVVQRLV